MLLTQPENSDYLAWIAEAAQRFQPDEDALYGGDYHVMGDNVSLQPPVDASLPFTSTGGVHYADWIESEQLFGCVRQYKDRVQLEPGLLHQANGGTLILSINTCWRSRCWLRLRKVIELGRFDWYSPDERRPRR